MINFNQINSPTKLNLLISFLDLTNFRRTCRGKTDEEVFELLSEFYTLSGEIIAKNNGKIIKFIGDSAIVVFPEDCIDQGVNTLKQLKNKIESDFEKKNIPSRLDVKIHFGEVIGGLLGTKENKTFDIIGEAVNTTALLKSFGFSMTPQVFRKLNTDTRKLFKKHTPAIRYIPVEEKHKD
jgi:class 3 adenylate cyclase